MAKADKVLTVAGVRAATKNTADGQTPGLYLFVSPSGGKRWVFRYTSPTRKKPNDPNRGVLRDMPLGRVALEEGQPGLTLKAARSAAAEPRTLLDRGIDPIDHAEQEHAAKVQEVQAARVAGTPFREVAERLLKSREGTWKNTKHAAQWASTLEGLPAKLRDMPVVAITKRDVADALAHPWRTIPETGRRLLGRVMEVMAYAKGEDILPEQFSVAALKEGVLTLLGDQKEHRKAAGYGNFPALPWERTPAFWSALATHKGRAPDALRLLILTALRTAPVRLARWEHFDLERGVWTIPAADMKMDRAHRVPLSAEAVALLRGMEPKAAGFLFPGQRRTGRTPTEKPLSDMALLSVMRKMKGPDGKGWRDDEGRLAVPHGFRSSFRDWCADNGKPGDAAEAALAHKVKGKVEAAYNRSTLFDLRRPLMQEWADFVTQKGQQVQQAASAEPAARVPLAAERRALAAP